MKRFASAVLCLLLVTSICFGQAKTIPVAVTHAGDDPIGKSLAFALKEAIRGSHSFFLVDHEPLPKMPRIVVYLSTGDTSVGQEKGFITGAGVAIAYAGPRTPALGILVIVTGRQCGSASVELCAKDILSEIDRAVEFLRKGWPEFWKTL